jgi:nitrate/TMAO reductase-like tetraheme cytochrome c subunit
MARGLVAALTRNTLTIIGSAIALACAVLIVALFIIDMMGFRGGVYMGILTYLVLPTIFVLGLLLVPLGIARERRRSPDPHAHRQLPVIDLNQPRTRWTVLGFLAITAVSIVILAGATYQGVHVMDSTEFCGTACHTVMQPEYTAYQRSPHARVSCADCHIGAGADWFVKSKLSGSWQLIAVTFDLYPKPIPSPVENLRPARETCEECHWPTQFIGDRLWVDTVYEKDEANTELKNVLLLRVGGIQGRQSSGIHWHVDPDVKIRYRADEKRETIYDVELTRADGTVRVFKNGEVPEDAAPWRTMDCLDCHNRPTHTFQLPDREINRALREGQIDKTLPFVKREALRILEQKYESHADARSKITAELEAFYREKYPEVMKERGDAVRQAAAELGNIYSWNVFPKMNVTWGTYPNQLGHEDFPGCFRCHDDEHETADGKAAISQDCDTCHTLLALEEESPEILEQLKP